jgi:prepilin-type N-terminal cleavage/methylation domain-containing protein
VSNRMKDNNRQAFTLIELLIVVAIIGILAAIAIPNFLQAQTRAKVSRAKTDLRTLSTAMELYYTDNLAYPPEYLSGRSTYSPLYPDSVRSVYSQTHLTTPVDYVSNVLYDVFISRWDPPCYWFYNWLEGYGRMVQTPTGQTAAYGLWSLGPDHTASAYTPYDPTNGTVSFGDIVRFGPGGTFLDQQ